MQLRVGTTKIWSAVTCHRFICFGDLSPKQGRVQRPGKNVEVSFAFDGDKSPAKSADKSAHSKTCACGASRAGFIRVHSWFLAAWLGFNMLFASPSAFAQTADDYFHVGAVNYLSNNIPQALAVVSNGLAIFPDDIKLKKLEELLKQQQQRQQQQQEQEQQKDQQSQQDQKSEQQKQDEDQKQADKKEQEQKQDQQQAKKDEKSGEKPEEKEQQMAAHAMTPQEAKQLLDAQKGDEKVLQFIPEGEPKPQGRVLKDW